MTKQIWFGAAATLVLATAVGAATALVQADKAKDKTTGAGEKASAEMMAKWKELGTPGAAHKVLDPMVGKWNVKMTCRESPGGPPQENTGQSDIKWIFDGRFLEENVSGKHGDDVFVGRGLCGYDNLLKKYVGAWVDDMSTGIMTNEGTYDAASKELRFTGKCPDPTAGKYTDARMVLKIGDPNHLTMQAYKTGPDGKEFLMAEMDYTRAK